MFNFALLDVAIGLIFIFLVYSLLATSINEVIATLFSLRARMLKIAIRDRMLAETKKHAPFVSIGRGFLAFISEFLFFITGRPEKPNSTKKIGDWFYEHPLIKSYGASGLFKLPSYIPNKNFSVVITELLGKEFDRRLNDIIEIKLLQKIPGQTRESITVDLAYAGILVKIKEIIDFYQYHYKHLGVAPEGSIIDKETSQLLALQIKEGLFTLEGFVKKSEEWFDNTMNRASGWYKRQSQAILFVIGIVMAVVFNVDSIMISSRLNEDPEARMLLLDYALKEKEKLKEHPQLKIDTPNRTLVLDTSETAKEYIARLNKAIDTVKNEIASLKTPNDIIGLGWGDYGRKNDSLKLILRYYKKELRDTIGLDTALWKNPEKNKAILDIMLSRRGTKICYIISECGNVRKIIGLFITAFAICLGAPFWFDLLNKFTKIRGTGKKEGSDAATPSNQSPVAQPVNIQVSTQPGEEAAVG